MDLFGVHRNQNGKDGRNKHRIDGGFLARRSMMDGSILLFLFSGIAVVRRFCGAHPPQETNEAQKIPAD